MAQNYGTYDREFLAIISAARKFKHYLHSAEITIYTDHQALTELKTKPIDQLSDTHGRRVRWLAELEALSDTWKIVHKSGDKNGHSFRLHAY